MKYNAAFVLGTVVCAVILSGCTKSGGKRMLTREVFTKAVSKCQPVDATFTWNADGPPSVAISILDGSSTVPDCMAKEFDGYALKQLQINYVRSGNPEKQAKIG